MTWKFETSGFDGQCTLFGVNIFQYRWRDCRETAAVIDPHSVSYTHLDVYKRQEEYDEEEDEMRYEEDEVFPADLFYSFYYYSWQAVLAYRGALEQEVSPEFLPKIAAVLEGL